MIKISEWLADVKKAGGVLEKELKNDPDLKARLDAELYKCDLLKEIEERKEKEKEKKRKSG